ncbi:hypothetical protein T439DRAFT_98424 [Meredithblackwellia eburnea MCA 4105]
MCIIFWTQSLDNYQLVLAANRDEFLDRPTTSAAWHDWPSSQTSTSSSQGSQTVKDEGNTLSGLDLEGGGTWLGVTRGGGRSASAPTEDVDTTKLRPRAPRLRFATLTNYTEVILPTIPPRPSRGDLVKGFLDSTESVRDFLDKLEAPTGVERERWMDKFAGFNLLVGEIAEGEGEELVMGYATNRDKELRNGTEMLKAGDGVRGLSNSTLRDSDVGIAVESDAQSLSKVGGKETPPLSVWPKVFDGCQAFGDVVGNEGREDDVVAKLWGVLSTSNSQPITSRTGLRHTILVRPLPLNPKAPLAPPSTSVPPSSGPPPTPAPADLPDYKALLKEGKQVPGGRWYATRVQTLVLISRAKDDEGELDVRFIERDAYRLGSDGFPVWAGEEPRREFKFKV